MSSSPQSTTFSANQFVYLGADHGGFELKEQLKGWLTEWGVSFHDLGAHSEQDDDDYPVFALAVAKRVAEMPSTSLGILICRSGGGMAIAANKVTGVRALPVYEAKHAEIARSHDHANVITLAGDWMSADAAKAAVLAFLKTKPDYDERHVRRVRLINEYEGTV